MLISLLIFISFPNFTAGPVAKLTAYAIYFSCIIISLVFENTLSSDCSHEFPYFPESISGVLIFSDSEDCLF